ncbi:hypothetical protein KAU33_02465 [Candidatus Dependentiae bacterium]|nr:hypothetical protein [Candidatus Dependentiae bacterium]
MIERITELIIPQIIEEWIAALLLMAIWTYEFGFKVKYKEDTVTDISISDRVISVLLAAFCMTILSFSILKLIFQMFAEIFPAL